MERIVLAIIMAFALGLVSGQAGENIDERISELDSTRKDTVQAQLLLELADQIFEDPRGTKYIHRLDQLLEELESDTSAKVRAYAARTQPYAINLIGLDLRSRLEYAKALKTFQRALVLFEHLRDTAGVCLMYNNIGYLLDGVDPLRAIGAYKESLRWALSMQQPSDFWESIPAHIGLLFSQIGQLDSASYYIDQAPMEGVDSETIAHNLLCLGKVRHAQERLPEALDALDRSISISAVNGYHQLHASALSRMVTIKMMQREFNVALSISSRFVAFVQGIGNNNYLSHAWVQQGAVLDSLGDHSGAEAVWRKALALATRHDYLAYQRDAAAGLKGIYERSGRYKNALAMSAVMAEATDSLVARDARQDMMLMEFRAEQRKDSLANAAEKHQVHADGQAQVSQERTRRNVFLIIGVILLAAAGVLLVRLRRSRKARKMAEMEKDRSENLLLNILPAEIAEELKAKGRADARDFDMVSILFSDFKGFTEASAVLSSQELVREINICFEAFDHIMTEHGIEKIKTIGDAYMAAGGLPVHTVDSVKNTVLAGLAMQEFMAKRKAENDSQGKPAFQMRIGIHTGPVVAGIVGVKKFQYDIWGDTVNTASRMESSGEVGQVNISEATYELVKADPAFTFNARGKVQAKGKGEMEMYFVERSVRNP